MPFTLTWHPSLPVLMTAYVGVVSAQDVAALRDQRRQMLEARDSQVMLLVDTQGMDDFAGKPSPSDENILLHPCVERTLIVLPADLYRALSRNFRHQPRRGYRAAFFATPEAALSAAEVLARKLG